ncbi:hypothetical protein JOD29_003056 [Lysinibacillus composti]|uniref:Uncharacterized protein n=1 Tax=Lysinibacillus composti TaxID=720633 RepID=A0A3N9UAG1_9BACI|nr:hypothetical protein [Lysinibacillus composti]MBM7609780.1 hypothetical protein [Lysinibacillus composti]RQW73559.1 hypothetical protein EBB45_15730 [Lysinibacillus composti]
MKKVCTVREGDKVKLIKILLFSFILFLVACSDEEHLIFDNKKDAEQEIGEFKAPVMPEGYQMKQITYDNDGFTHPVTKVFYEKGSHNITFMIASSWFDDRPSKKIENDHIAEMEWISKDKEFVLKWRKSNQQSYKYLFTNNKKDKEWLISVAEHY